MNYDSSISINQAETTYLQSTVQNIEQQGILKIQSITTDGSRSLAKCMRTLNSKRRKKIPHYRCFVHNMRNFHKKIRSLKIKCPTGRNRIEYTKILASKLRTRIRMELQRLDAVSKTRPEYHQRANEAIKNILDCFQGVHTRCRKMSVVCIAHLKKYKLPYIRKIKAIQGDFSSGNFVSRGTTRIPSNSRC